MQTAWWAKCSPVRAIKLRAGQLIVRLENTRTQTLEEARSRAAVELGGAQEAVRVAQKELDAYPLPRIFVGLTAQQAAQIWLDNLDLARADFAPYEDTSRKTLKPNHHIFPSLPRRIWFDTDEYSGMAKEYNKQVDVAWMNYRKAVDVACSGFGAGDGQGTPAPGPSELRRPAGCLAFRDNGRHPRGACQFRAARAVCGHHHQSGHQTRRARLLRTASGYDWRFLQLDA